MDEAQKGATGGGEERVTCLDERGPGGLHRAHEQLVPPDGHPSLALGTIPIALVRADEDERAENEDGEEEADEVEEAERRQERLEQIGVEWVEEGPLEQGPVWEGRRRLLLS
jgi:hypothetical protein